MADISKVSIPNVQNPYDIKDAKSQAALVPVINKGSKNLLKNDANSTGIATVNSDGSVTLNGSQSTDLSLTLSNTLVLDAGTYVISAGTIMQSKTYFTIVIVSGGTQYSVGAANRNGYLSFTLNEKTNIPRVYIWVDKNTTVNNLTIKPMITTAAEFAISPEYEPYAPTNRELYEDKAATEDVYGTTTTIAPASGETYNLNDLPIGRFQVPSSSYAQRITNSPTTSSGYDIECKYNGSSSYKYQIARPNSAGSAAFNIYVRHFGTTWSDWETVLTNTKVDSTPTQSSPNPVSSGGVWSTLSELVDGGAKNLANWSASTSTINNVVFTISGGVVTVTLNSGTKATARSQKALSLHFPDELESGAYVLSGSPTLGAGGLYMWDNTAGGRVTPTSDIGSGTAFTFNYDKTHSYIITVDIAINQAIDNNNPLVFKPMICTAADWAISQKYVSYCPSLPEVYARTVAHKVGPTVVTGATTLAATGVSFQLSSGSVYRLTAVAKYKAVNLDTIAIKYTISGTAYTVCSNSITPASNTVYLTTNGIVTPSSNILPEVYVKTETQGNVEIMLIAETIFTA